MAKNVVYLDQTGNYMVKFRVNGKVKSYGTFKTAEEAAEVANVARIEAIVERYKERVAK